ncbi:hypothetical protein [Nonomuraea sp. NPDC048826]|uniref:hypothetical protein n=1 Tax=Nonomuraea sp. NPDC048826 TaxID=3364347 RepID=UPI00371EF0E1
MATDAVPTARRPTLVPLSLLVAGVAALFVHYQVVVIGGALRAVAVGSYSSFGLPLAGAYDLPAPGVRVTASEVSYLVPDPSLGHHVMLLLTEAPGFVVVDGAVVLMGMLLWRVRRGVYSPPVARLVRVSGWWLVAGGLVAAVVEEVARLRLLAAVSQETTGFGLRELEPVMLLAGVGMLVVGHVLRDAARMREDLEGTV